MNPAIKQVGGFAWKNRITIAPIGLLVLFSVFALQRPSELNTVEQAASPLSSQAFNPATLEAAQAATMNSEEANFIAFWNEERQLATYQRAANFIAAANRMAREDNHPCYGRAVVTCLRSFHAARMDRLNRGASDEYAIALLEIEALFLAEALETPPSVQTEAQKTVLRQYPILVRTDAAGLPIAPAALNTRPATATAAIERRRNVYGQSAALSQEARLSMPRLDGSSDAYREPINNKAIPTRVGSAN